MPENQSGKTNEASESWIRDWGVGEKGKPPTAKAKGENKYPPNPDRRRHTAATHHVRQYHKPIGQLRVPLRHAAAHRAVGAVLATRTGARGATAKHAAAVAALSDAKAILGDERIGRKEGTRAGRKGTERKAEM